MKEIETKAKAVIVLAMHGAPPLDFPRPELAEFFGLEAKTGHGRAGECRDASRLRFQELETKMRAWPRTPQNDPFYAGSLDLAKHLRRASGLEVVVGFNEFCAPPLDEAFDRAARAARTIVVVTPMMTRGGEHSAVDIPEAIRRAGAKYPAVRFVYAWPFATEDIARFLASQVTRFLQSAG
jgi:sirohydrochlorin cobaltochelatase